LTDPGMGGTEPGAPKIGLPGIGLPGGPGPGGGRPGNPGGFEGGFPPGGSSIQNPAGSNAQDPTRSVRVVLPGESDPPPSAPFYSHLGGFHPTSNPNWRPKYRITYRGEKLAANLFTDSSTVQWYETFKEIPGFTSTHEIATRNRHVVWAKAKADPKEGYSVV